MSIPGKNLLQKLRRILVTLVTGFYVIKDEKLLININFRLAGAGGGYSGGGGGGWDAGAGGGYSGGGGGGGWDGGSAGGPYP